MSGLKNLIMGLWVRQPFRLLEKFIASLRCVGFAGDVCLCVEEISADTVVRLRACGIIVVRSALTALPNMPTRASRNFTFLDFLTSHGDEYANVLLIDPATAVLQSDPFAALLPADIVYTQERRRLCESQVDHDAVVQAYGEGIAHNIRDCMTSITDAIIGTRAGIQRYLVAMTRELHGRAVPITGAIDQGVHNYIVHMGPLRGAWLDPGSLIATAMHTMPDEAVQISEHGALIDGKLVPVLCRWSEQTKVREYVNAASRFRLDETIGRAWPVAATTDAPVSPGADRVSRLGDAVVAFYQRERDEKWLRLFLGSLRCVTNTIGVHCVGDFNHAELQELARHDCIAHQVPAIETEIAENVAHFYLSQVLDKLAVDQSKTPRQVLMLDTMRAIFPRDPFLCRTIGLSAFAEGPTRIADSPFNRQRLAYFVPPERSGLQVPVVSSALLRGSIGHLRQFYRRLFAELVGRADLLRMHKVIQGAFNKLCHGGDLGFPVIVQPNGAEAYFDLWASGLAVDTRHGVRIAGRVPAVVLGGEPETALMRKLRIDLSLSQV